MTRITLQRVGASAKEQGNLTGWNQRKPRCNLSLTSKGSNSLAERRTGECGWADVKADQEEAKANEQENEP